MNADSNFRNFENSKFLINQFPIHRAISWLWLWRFPARRASRRGRHPALVIFTWILVLVVVPVFIDVPSRLESSQLTIKRIFEFTQLRNQRNATVFLCVLALLSRTFVLARPLLSIALSVEVDIFVFKCAFFSNILEANIHKISPFISIASLSQWQFKNIFKRWFIMLTRPL